MSSFLQQLDQIEVEKQKIFAHHDSQIKKLKDEFFFGLKFDSTEQVQRATQIFTTSMISLQVVSGIGSIYYLYKLKTLPGLVLFGLSMGFGYPVSYQKRKNDEITAKLDVLENQIHENLRTLQTKKQEILSKKENPKKGFWGSLKGIFS